MNFSEIELNMLSNLLNSDTSYVTYYEYNQESINEMKSNLINYFKYYNTDNLQCISEDSGLLFNIINNYKWIILSVKINDRWKSNFETPRDAFENRLKELNK